MTLARATQGAETPSATRSSAPARDEARPAALPTNDAQLLAPGALLSLQRAMGNASVGRLLARGLQRKIAVETAEAAEAGGRARTTVGVGEEATFTEEGDHPWTIGKEAKGAGPSATWQAPGTEGSVNVTHGDSNLTMDVVEPKSVHAEIVGVVPPEFYAAQKPPRIGLGMALAMVNPPKNVSFANAEVREGVGDGEATGVWDEPRYSQLGGGVTHRPNREFARLSKAGGKHPANSTPDEAAALLFPDGGLSERAGTLKWEIPYHFRVAGDDGEGKQYATVSQSQELKPGLNLTVSKGGKSVSEQVPDIQPPAKPAPAADPSDDEGGDDAFDLGDSGGAIVTK